ncbi:hypothetical protein P775_06405 [Puniceibacterium antarcticum]|uniref:Uncharacterized protein n=1 Tax=Puniceibacterium antarcticum TaxID=1206336 RepID=A0A2G8RHC0_9RHOB|nr:hypothetical protein P775_06405 [Puniceibacterium antarcticum]
MEYLLWHLVTVFAPQSSLLDPLFGDSAIWRPA